MRQVQSYLILPCPKGAAMLDAFALDDVDHGNYGLLRRNDPFDLPGHVDI